MLDTFESLILRALQDNGRASTQELSDLIGLSPSPCWRRVKKLEDEGYIERYAAILNPKKLGLNALAQVQVSLIDHNETSVDIFQTFVMNSPQVLDCASITGDFDFILKVAAKDPEALEAFIMQKLLRLGVVRTTTTNFVLRQIKSHGPLPVDVA